MYVTSLNVLYVGSMAAFYSCTAIVLKLILGYTCNFTARCICCCSSVCLSVALWYCVITAKRIVEILSLYGGPIIVFFAELNHVS